MKYPRTIKKYCPKCRSHQIHNVALYKKGKERTLNQGRRRLERKKRGYGSFPKPIFHKNAKLNKRITPLLECSVCGKKRYAQSHRTKRIELHEV